MKTINIFDFDGTLFNSPVPNSELWDKNFSGVSKIHLPVKASDGSTIQLHLVKRTTPSSTNQLLIWYLNPPRIRTH